MQLSESKTAIIYVKYEPRSLKPFDQLASVQNVKSTNASVRQSMKRVRWDKMSMGPKIERLNLTNKTKYSKGTDRQPTILLNGKNIKYVKTFKLLEVYHDEKLDIPTHCDNMSESLRSNIHKLSRLAGSKWSLNCQTLKTIYLGVFVARMAYTART